MSTFKADYIIARQEELAGNTSSIPVKTVVNGTAKAWVNFNGTGTIAIRANFNTASLTDNGTGDYTVNFATALADANYAWSGNAGYGTTVVGDGLIVTLYGAFATYQLVGSVRFNTSDPTSGAFDAQYCSLMAMR